MVNVGDRVSFTLEGMTVSGDLLEIKPNGEYTVQLDYESGGGIFSTRELNEVPVKFEVGDRVTFKLDDKSQQGSFLRTAGDQFVVQADRDEQEYYVSKITLITTQVSQQEFVLGEFVIEELVDGSRLGVITEIGTDGTYQVVDRHGNDNWVVKSLLHKTDRDFDDEEILDNTRIEVESVDESLEVFDDPDGPGLGLGTTSLVSFEDSNSKGDGGSKGDSGSNVRTKPRASADTYVKIGIVVLFAAIIYNN